MLNCPHPEKARFKDRVAAELFLCKDPRETSLKILILHAPTGVDAARGI